MADSYRSGRTSEVKVGAHRTAPETLLPSSLLRERISFHGSLGINSHRPYTVTDTGTAGWTTTVGDPSPTAPAVDTVTPRNAKSSHPYRLALSASVLRDRTRPSCRP